MREWMAIYLEAGIERVTNEFNTNMVLLFCSQVWKSEFLNLYIILWGQLYPIVLFVNEGLMTSLDPSQSLGYILLKCLSCIHYKSNW